MLIKASPIYSGNKFTKYFILELPTGDLDNLLNYVWMGAMNRTIVSFFFCYRSLICSQITSSISELKKIYFYLRLRSCQVSTKAFTYASIHKTSPVNNAELNKSSLLICLDCNTLDKSKDILLFLFDVKIRNGNNVRGLIHNRWWNINGRLWWINTMLFNFLNTPKETSFNFKICCIIFIMKSDQLIFLIICDVIKEF